MSTKLKSVGKCIYCSKEYAKRSISQHLENHLKAETPKARKIAFHLRVEVGPFFLHLLMNGSTKLADLDNFLRKIWLECCGHMSQFASGGAWGDEIGQSRKAKDVFSKGAKLNYVYDFGSSTELLIKVIGKHPIFTRGITLLSRNEPLEILCHKCKKKPAENICSVHIYEEGGWMFCDTCSEEHEEVCPDAEEYAWLDVCNSPRMGVCAYEGGMIDEERDGVFKK